ENGQAMLQPTRAGKPAVCQQAMIANVDAECPEQVETGDSPSHSRPAEQPGHAGRQGEQMKAQYAGEDAPGDAARTAGVEITQPPEPAIDDTGTCEHSAGPPCAPGKTVNLMRIVRRAEWLQEFRTNWSQNRQPGLSRTAGSGQAACLTPDSSE